MNNIPLHTIPNILDYQITEYQINTSSSFINNDISIYIHFPFCKTKCTFCPISTVVYEENLVNDYIDVLIKEINSKKNILNKLNITCVHFGGGTPSLMNTMQFNKIINTISKYANVDDIEILIEAHPKYTTYKLIEYLSNFKKCTLNFGVQSFNDDILFKTNRNYISNDAIKIIEYAKSKLKVIGIDYIADCDEMTSELVLEDLEYIKKIDVNHISCYPLLKKNKIYNSEKKILLNDIFTSALLRMGYTRYSIYHFEKKECNSHLYGKNQLNGKNWIGFGSNAYSYFNNKLKINQNINNYMLNYENGLIYNFNEQLTDFWNICYKIRRIPIDFSINGNSKDEYKNNIELLIKILKNKFYIEDNEYKLSNLGVINISKVEEIIKEVFLCSKQI
ncbi:putative uncharacterized protein [Coprobacillus sp. CAG:698]|nr:putative uncharacterized protein [Coprobacillus sp. CAG:698]